jgi:hypothetical protein
MTNSIITSTRQWLVPVGSDLSRPARVLVRVIRLYQRLTSGRPSPCRFYPSCSNYADEAISAHGALRGSLLALRRLGRCRPLGPHGVDFVPMPKKTRSVQK